MVRLLRIDHIMIVRVHPQLNIHSERRESLAQCYSRRRNPEIWSHSEEGLEYQLDKQTSLFY